jgi:phenylalanyl-tRNA synthetase alpha chain
LELVEYGIMNEKIREIEAQIEAFTISSKQQLEEFRIKFLGSKGIVKELFGELKSVPNEQKREVGQLLNGLRVAAQEHFDKAQLALESTQDEGNTMDFSRPGDPIQIGARHPLSIVRSEIIEIFSRIGFMVSEGPEIEDDWHNFSALNFPPEHPARDMQDTFFIEKGEEEIALRTHTSSVQVRVMENETPPIRTISPKRSHFCPGSLFLSPSGRTLYRQRCFLRRFETNLTLFCQRNVW